MNSNKSLSKIGSPQMPMRNTLHMSQQSLDSLYNAQQHHNDYILSDYVDKIGTRINLLETELKFAWRALDLLSGEYGKMWRRLDKLENLTIEQQGVLTNLMGLYKQTNMTQQQEQQY